MEDISLGGPALADNPSGDGVASSFGSDRATRVSAPSGGDTWPAALSEDNRRLVENKGWRSPDDALKSYRQLDEYRGRSVALPGDQATDEDWKAFRHKTGMPEAADGYALTMMDGADENATATLKELFHKAELDQRQAQALYGGMAEALAMSRQMTTERQAEQLAEARENAEASLTRAWGATDGEIFRRNIEMARRAVEALGGDGLLGELRQLGALTDSNQILSPVPAKAFAEVGAQLFAEDSLIEGGEAITANPFADGSLNLAAQGDLVKRDPARARGFIQAAGKRPENYGLSSH
ncbi:MAG: hypothetical protein HQ483_18365 [Rhodospirillales bacterium]|nr:hypothetical protein [Rhodospirillales bacterium]